MLTPSFSFAGLRAGRVRVAGVRRQGVVGIRWVSSAMAMRARVVGEGSEAVPRLFLGIPLRTSGMDVPRYVYLRWECFKLYSIDALCCIVVVLNVIYFELSKLV